MRGRPKPRAVLPARAARVTPGPCIACEGGYASLQSNLTVLASHLPDLEEEMPTLESIHGHGFSEPELQLDPAECTECHYVGQQLLAMSRKQ